MDVATFNHHVEVIANAAAECVSPEDAQRYEGHSYQFGCGCATCAGIESYLTGGDL